MSNSTYERFVDKVIDDLPTYANNYVSYLMAYQIEAFERFLEWCAEEEGVI